MAIDYHVDVETNAGVKLGPGPITSVSAWSVTRRADRAGSFSITMLASDELATYVTSKRVISIHALLNGAQVYLGSGIIDKINKAPQPNGMIQIQVSGDDQLRELAYTVLRGVDANGNGAAIAALLHSYNGGWTFVADPAWGLTVPAFYLRFDGETILNAAFKIAENAGSHAYLSDTRELSYATTPTASGVRAIQATGDLAPETCAIISLEELTDSFDLVTNAMPYGAGQGATQLTLAACTRTAPAGYTYSAAGNYIRHTASYSTYGQIDRRVEFRDLAPLSNTDADLEAAANALFDATIAWLSYRVAPQKSYRLKVAGCSQLLLPMESIRVAYRDNDLTINEDLVILESTMSCDASGILYGDLIVSNVANWPADDAGVVADSAAQSQVFQAHQQLNANAYTTGYNKTVDDTYNATFRFRFGSEVCQIQQILFEFQILPLESTAKTIGGTATGSATLPPHAHNVALPAHVHTIAIDSDATTHGFARIMYFDPTTGNLYYDLSGGLASTFTSNNGGGTTVASANPPTGIPISISIGSALTLTYGIFRESGANTFALVDLEYSVNGGTWFGLNGSTPLGGGWYQLDITALVQNATTFRPLQESNTLDIRKATAAPSKTAQIDALLSVRNIIQSIDYL